GRGCRRVRGRGPVPPRPGADPRRVRGAELAGLLARRGGGGRPRRRGARPGHEPERGLHRQVPDPAPPPGVPWRRLEPGARATPPPRPPADVAPPLSPTPRCPGRPPPMRPGVRPPFVPDPRPREERAPPGSVLTPPPPLTPSSLERDLMDLAGL